MLSEVWSSCKPPNGPQTGCLVDASTQWGANQTSGGCFLRKCRFHRKAVKISGASGGSICRPCLVDASTRRGFALVPKLRWVEALSPEAFVVPSMMKALPPEAFVVPSRVNFLGVPRKSTDGRMQQAPRNSAELAGTRRNWPELGGSSGASLEFRERHSLQGAAGHVLPDVREGAQHFHRT